MIGSCLFFALMATIQAAAAATSIILPLYQYPENGAWNPIYKQAGEHPHIKFQVIINPNNGPDGSSADEDFTAAMTKLHTYPNVEVLGYVRTGYGKRKQAAIVKEVDEYARWAAHARPSGIFFDEVQDTAHALLAKCTAHVKATTAFGTARTVIYNPGTVPEIAALYDAPDQIVVFESPYKELAGEKSALKGISGVRKSKLSAIVTGYGNSAQEMATLNSGLFDGYASLYLTRDPATYQAFGSDWPEFCKLMAPK